MAEIVNLRVARKRKRRADKSKDAGASRTLHGRSAADRQAGDLQRGLDVKRLEAHRRDPQGPAGDDGAA